MNEQRSDHVPVQERRDPKLLRRIEDLCDRSLGLPPIVVKCSVDDSVSLLVFDLPVPKELLVSDPPVEEAVTS